MVDIVITYETLFDILRKEKSKSELQQLPADFYGQVVGYIRELHDAVEAAGGIAASGSQKSLVQLRNAQKILRELYERRERKILEMALNRARTESNIVDTSTLLSQEKPFYEESAGALSTNKTALLEPILRGEAPAGVTVPPRGELGSERSEQDERGSERGERSDASRPSLATAPVDPNAPSPEEVAAQESCKVKFVVAVPKFLGLHGEVHGPFEPGETATLQGKIAAVLLKKRRVEIA